MQQITYKDAGVNLDAAQNIKQRIKNIVAPTHGAQVLGGFGGFGALYQLNGYDNPVLVSSTDGVGTKLKLAIQMNRYDSIGEDLVNACVNDIIVCGAQPLFFLDYLAVGALDNDVIASLISGMARACQQAGCALIGGETAQMPGIYAHGDFDMAGFILGAVERNAILDGNHIRPNDHIIGLPSNGLHTNGYSLVRHALNLDNHPEQLSHTIPELGENTTLADALLLPHPSYVDTVRPVLHMLKGMAHITGGGIIENVPRILPENTAAHFDASTWRIPPIFTYLQQRADISNQEMYRVFNMGIGMTLFCDPNHSQDILQAIPQASLIGAVAANHSAERIHIA